MEIVNVKVKHLRSGQSGNGKKYKDLKEWIEDENNLYIGRSGVVFVLNETTGKKERYPKKNSPWCNPFKVKSEAQRTASIERYKDYIRKLVEERKVNLCDLKGKRLGCWCKPLKCHGDVLMDMISLM